MKYMRANVAAMAAKSSGPQIRFVSLKLPIRSISTRSVRTASKAGSLAKFAVSITTAAIRAVEVAASV